MEGFPPFQIPVLTRRDRETNLRAGAKLQTQKIQRYEGQALGMTIQEAINVKILERLASLKGTGLQPVDQEYDLNHSGNAKPS